MWKAILAALLILLATKAVRGKTAFAAIEESGIAGETACATTSGAVLSTVGLAVSPADFLARQFLYSFIKARNQSDAHLSSRLDDAQDLILLSDRRRRKRSRLPSQSALQAGPHQRGSVPDAGKFASPLQQFIVYRESNPHAHYDPSRMVPRPTRHPLYDDDDPGFPVTGWMVTLRVTAR